MPETSTRSRTIVFAVGAAVVVLDQLTKALVLVFLPLHHSVPVVDGLVNLVHVRNPGAAFSLLADAPAWLRQPFFITLTLAAVVVLAVLAGRLGPEERVMRLAMGGVLGGALGNLIDRLRYGEVIDFLDVHWGDLHWPAFNVADSSITIAVAAVVVQSLFGGRAENGRERARAPDGPGAA